MKKIGLLALMMMAVQAASAFPTWIGTFGIYKKHDDRANPGQFATMMNQDYVGLRAEVGIQVNGGNWVMYPMQYTGKVSGNSYWTFTPSFQFPGGATVKYFFHGFDANGGNIWDSRNGLNYEFRTSPAPEPMVSRLADGVWSGDYTNANGITYMRPWNTWLDIKVKGTGAPEAIGILWTWNGWTDYRTETAIYEGDLAGGYQQWGVDLAPAGFEYSHRSLGFIRWFPAGSSNYTDVVNGSVTLTYAIFYKVNGVWYWDNNGGKDYQLIVGTPKTPIDPNDTDADGLLDAWELEHFGHLVYGPTENPDGDGAVGMPLANIIEQQTSNNPNVPNDPTGVRLMWANAYPGKGEPITLSYSMGNEASPLFGKPIYAHIGHNGWTSTYQTAQLTWNGANSRLEIQVTVPSDATELNVVFTDKNAAWDNNGGKNWKIPVRK